MYQLSREYDYLVNRKVWKNLNTGFLFSNTKIKLEITTESSSNYNGVRQIQLIAIKTKITHDIEGSI